MVVCNVMTALSMSARVHKVNYFGDLRVLCIVPPLPCWEGPLRSQADMGLLSFADAACVDVFVCTCVALCFCSADCRCCLECCCITFCWAAICRRGTAPCCCC